MRVSLLADTNWEAKIDHATKVVDLRFFDEHDYGPGLSSLVIVLNCREPELEHKQRIRHLKSTNTLYIDVMLDLAYFIHATHVNRRKKIEEQILTQVQAVLNRRKIKNFERERLLSDLANVLNEQLNGSESTRFDVNCLERATGY